MIKIKKIKTARKIKDDFSKGDRAVVYQRLLEETIKKVQRIQKDFNYDRINNKILNRSKMVEFKLISEPKLTIENTYGPYDKKLINKETIQPKEEVDKYEENFSKISSSEPEYDENFVVDAVSVIGSNVGELQGGIFTYALRSRFGSKIEDRTFVNKGGDDISNYANVLKNEVLNWFNKKYIKTVTETKENEENKYELTFNFSNPSVDVNIGTDNLITVGLDFDYFLKERTGSEYEGKVNQARRVNKYVNERRSALEKENENLKKQGLEEKEIPALLQERKKTQVDIANGVINRFDEFSKYNINSAERYFPNFRKSFVNFKKVLKDYLTNPTNEGLQNASNSYASLLNNITSDFEKQGLYTKEKFGLQNLNIDEAIKGFEEMYKPENLLDEEGNLTYNPEDLA